MAIVSLCDDLEVARRCFFEPCDFPCAVAPTRPPNRAGNDEPGDKTFERSVLHSGDLPCSSGCNLGISEQRTVMEMS